MRPYGFVCLPLENRAKGMRHLEHLLAMPRHRMASVKENLLAEIDKLR